MDNVFAEISVLGTGVSRSVFRDLDNEARWDVTKIPGFMGERSADKLTMLDGVGFQNTNEDNFGFMLKDSIADVPIFDSTKRSLIMTDKYLEIGFTLPTQILFGLGQHNSKFLLSEGDWTMFNRDQPGSPPANGGGEDMLYGTHPFLMVKTRDNKFAGILFYNSNPQQVTIRFSKSGKSLITYKTIGGILDIYYIMPNTADEVIRKYNNLIGRPALPPFWSLGFHQCSWAYNTTKNLVETVAAYQSGDYPFDTIWSDIEYMDRYIDFTVDDDKFAGLKKYVDNLHSQNLYFVPIVDAGVSMTAPLKGTNWYKEGDDKGIFIKTSQNPDKANGNLIGQVWPGYSAFVDFLHPNANAFWSKGLSELWNLVPFDGVWLDMNEPSNFCSDKNGKSLGECYPAETEEEYSNIKSERRELKEPPVKPGEYDNIPFVPGKAPLITKTISMDAYLHTDGDNKTFTMYNIHNMYGTLETIATSNYLSQKDTKRQLIISRDSFVGHGKYGSIWTGDNDATQLDMKYSINQIMHFNMFGMPFVGGDICGFGGNTNDPLCARWAHVGSFYPFMRNHYSNTSIPHEFFRLAPKYQTGIKAAMRMRYSLLRYMYTMLYKSSINGDPMIRHPMYQWPDVYEMVHDETSFLIGPAIRYIANFDISETPKDFKVSVPKGRYMDYRSYGILSVTDTVKTVSLYNGWDYPNVHILEGNIIPFQDASAANGVYKTFDLLGEQMRLLIFPDSNGYAKGNLFIARGEKKDENEQYYTLIHANKAIQVIFERGTITDKGSELNEVIEEIHIVGIPDVAKVDFACVLGKDQLFKPLVVSTATNKLSNTTYLKLSGGDNTIQFDESDTIFYGINGVDYNYCNKGYKSFEGERSDTQRTYTLKKDGDNSNSGLTITLKLLPQTTVQVTITDGNKRFIVPKQALNENSFIRNNKPNADATIDDYVTVSNDGELFSLKIHEFQNPSSVYFQLDPNSLTFADYFLSLDTKINTNGKIYGMGERITDFFIKEGIYTTWAKDQTDPIDDGKRPGKNVYGVHPVYFTRSNSGKKLHWGMFNFNANAQDTKVSFSGPLGAQISHYISGQGIFDMYFFIDNVKPEDVVTKYHDVIGHTLLPPFWSLGWNQCKYGYNSTEALQYVYDKYQETDFPMDVLWSDIDHMLKYRDFTYDSEGAYRGLNEFIEGTLHANNRKYVPILDAGIAIVRDGSYPLFDDGLKKGVFIKSGNPARQKNDIISGMGGVLYGKVWPGYAAFPDFTKQDTIDWWVKAIQDFHKNVSFDGIWLDMNEVANFCAGACIPEDVVPSQVSLKNKLVYQPGGGDIEEKCLSIDGVHSDGQTELNYHSLFGLMQGIATNKYFTDNKKRALIISRSTFAGQGKYTSHWNGDNESTWDYLRLGNNAVLNMNLYGINFNGNDI